MEEETYHMDPEEFSGVMEYELKRVDECGIKEYGFEVKTSKDYQKWQLIMSAPEDSDYKGSKYLIDVQFFDDYPVSNPKFTFKTKIYHCNVKDDGELNVNWMMKGMKIDYIMPRLLTLFYLQDTSVDENSEKSKLYGFSFFFFAFKLVFVCSSTPLNCTKSLDKYLSINVFISVLSKSLV